MNKCVVCEVNTNYGLAHDNGNLVCLACVNKIKEAHIKVYYPTDEVENA